MSLVPVREAEDEDEPRGEESLAWPDGLSCEIPGRHHGDECKNFSKQQIVHIFPPHSLVEHTINIFLS